MSAFLAVVRRFVVVGQTRIEITDCTWCTEDAVCTACSAKAHEQEKARKERATP